MKITKEKIEEYKQNIEELEYTQNGMHRLNGTNVEARNLRIRGEKVIADIYLSYEDREEKHLDLEYDIAKLEEDEDEK